MDIKSEITDGDSEMKTILCDIQNVCRICLSQDKSMVSIMSVEKKILADMYTSISSLQVQRNDGLPLQICMPCRGELIYCYHIKEKCITSYKTLKSLVKGSEIENGSCNQKRQSIKIQQTENQYGHENITKAEPKDEEKPNSTDRNELNDNFVEIEYLEEDGPCSSDNETLSMVQNITKNKGNNISITITDSSSLLKEMVSQKKKRKNLGKSYRCSSCPKKFMKAKQLSAHLKHFHGPKSNPYSCGQCKDSFTSEHDLKIHSALHSKGNVWKCVECHKEFTARARFSRHIRRHMTGKRFTCDTCGKQFSELYALRRHTRVHTGELVEKKFACQICDKKYICNRLLEAHMRRHSGERPCACDTCGKAFRSPRLLASHRLVHSDLKPYACSYCDKRFRHESTRNTHHRTHTGEKPYVCSICGKTFIQNSNLTLHMRSHTGDKPYSCDVCGRCFSSGSTLTSHKRTHTGEKPNSCPICHKRFARVDIKTHMRVHTGEKPFTCCICAKRFVNPWLLRDHQRLHTGEKPFECAICQQRFNTKNYLAKHIRNHDDNKEKPKVLMEPKKIQNVENRKVLFVRQVDYEPILVSNQIVFTGDRDTGEILEEEQNAAISSITCKDDSDKNITVQIGQDIPLEVSGELILQDESNMKTEVLVVEDNSNRNKYQSEQICLNADGVNFLNTDVNYGNEMNLVTVNDEGEYIAATSVMEGATVKLYQVDESLLQIHSSGGQLTISKITSKMTANFE